MNDLLLLAMLLDGPKHGYALKKEAGLIVGQLAMHNNLVYPLLQRFVRDGWVTQKESPGERGQTRHVYSLTPLGRRALVSRLSEYGEHQVHASEAFHLRVGLFMILGRGARAEILARRKTFLEARLQRFVALERGEQLGLYPGEVVRFLRGQVAAELAWVQHLERLSSVAKRKTSKRLRRVRR